MAESFPCSDFFGFQEALIKMRELDDKILYTLNTSLLTESFKGQVNHEETCRDLYLKLQTGHQHRENAINNCIAVSTELVKGLREQRELYPDNTEISKNIGSEHKKLRLLQSELYVEKIVKERSFKALNERCRKHMNGASFIFS